MSAAVTTERSLTGIMRNHTLMMVASTCRSVTVSHTVREHCRLSASLTGSQSAAFGAMRKMPSSRRPPLSRKLVAIWLGLGLGLGFGFGLGLGFGFGFG